MAVQRFFLCGARVSHIKSFQLYICTCSECTFHVGAQRMPGKLSVSCCQGKFWAQAGSMIYSSSNTHRVWTCQFPFERVKYKKQHKNGKDSAYSICWVG